MAEEGTSKQEGEQRLSQAALAQLYRGELGRSDRWRTRLDITTNWALTTTAAVISFTFANPSTSHVTLLVGIWLVVTFLVVETRRYRYYDLWIKRVRLLEDGFWAPLLRREPADSNCLAQLSTEISRPHIELSFFRAISTRLNRAYGSLLLLLLLTWFVKVFSHPTPAKTLKEFISRAHVGPVYGLVVSLVLLFFTLIFILLFASSLFATAPLGELQVRPDFRKMTLWEMFYRPYAGSRSRAESSEATERTRH